MRYALDDDCAVREATVFADLTAEPGEDALDGLKVDEAGNVYACGPGGVWIIAPDRRAARHSCGCPRTRTTWRGARPIAARCTSPRSPASTGSGSTSRACALPRSNP